MKLLFLILLSIVFGNKSVAQLFQPFSQNSLRLVQGIDFSPDHDVLYFTAPHNEYLQHNNLPISDSTPRLAMYYSHLENGQWSTPQLLPFSGQYKDYEPSLTPKGDILFFNSRRPYNGNENKDKNDIWFVKQQNDWSDPVYLTHLNTLEKDENYATIDQHGNLFYSKEILTDGKSIYTLFETQFDGENTLPGKQINMKNIPVYTGDPCVSDDGSYIIFTIYDYDNWQQTCDLYISFKQEGYWSAPIALDKLNSNGPDFSPTITKDGEFLYYRKNYQFIKYPFKEYLNQLKKQP